MDQAEYTSVLLISHNPFNMTLNNGKTFSSLFTGWDKNSIAQLYFHNTMPDFSICNNFFNITDESLLIRKKENIGEKITEDFLSKKTVSSKEKFFSFFRRGKDSSIISFLRNCIWATGRWNNEKLTSWVLDFTPEAIFLVGGGYIQAYVVAIKIAELLHIPIFLFFTDDYFSILSPFNPFCLINQLWLRANVKKTLKHINEIFVISEDMVEEYKIFFGITPILLRTPVNTSCYNSLDIKNTKKTFYQKNKIKLAYFGGLHLRRWESLQSLAVELEIFSKEHSMDISLSIYSNQKPGKKVLKCIDNGKNIRFAGSVNEKQIIDEFGKYDILVHAESFDFTARRKTRLSISTKIPEYLASGKPILAIGPKEVSSIRYLKKHNAAYIMTSFEHTHAQQIIQKIINDQPHYGEIGKRNKRIAEQNHSAEKNRSILKCTLSNAKNKESCQKA